MTGDSGKALTATEVVIADLAVRGSTNADIARDLDLTPATVERNLSRIYRKLGIRSQAELTIKARSQAGHSPTRGGR
jgi:DNA-binding NarL/FixJ family response regulator